MCVNKVVLEEALSYLHVSELKTLLEALCLSSKAFNKNELIARLLHYAVTGQELAPLKIPKVCCAQKGVVYPLQANTLMMYGSYKNDAKTREFFKQLIGPHFHFTAQGIDWLRERWLAGNSPTYEEFAQEWDAEYQRNKIEKRLPKQEWAYIRFVQEYLKINALASKDDINAAWELKRQEQVEYVNQFFIVKR